MIKGEDALDFGPPIHTYHEKKVGYEDPTNFFIRNRDVEQEGCHEKTFIFIVHGHKLFCKKEQDWEMEIVDEVENKMVFFVDNSKIFYYKKEEGVQKIICVEIGYMNYYIETNYIEELKEEHLINFQYDYQAEKLIMFYTIDLIKEKALAFKQVHKIKIYNLNTQQIEHEVRLQKKIFIELFRASEYQVIDGHIYYGNNVIKMRYDLLEEDAQNLCENKFFDKYTNMFKLRPGCSITTLDTINCHFGHRLGFLSEDDVNQNFCTKLRVTPYLHERRIYFSNEYSNRKNDICYMTNMRLSVN